MRLLELCYRVLSTLQVPCTYPSAWSQEYTLRLPLASTLLDHLIDNIGIGREKSFDIQQQTSYINKDFIITSQENEIIKT